VLREKMIILSILIFFLIFVTGLLGIHLSSLLFATLLRGVVYLHLFQGPHIAMVTMAAYECKSVDFPEPPYPSE
jgi:hypothetical protein